MGLHADGLKDVKFTLCEVAYNPPAYLKVGGKVAWNLTIDGDQVKAGTEELPAEECDLKIQGDHSIISNLAHIQFGGNDPKVVAAAQARLRKLSHWVVDGEMPENKVLRAVLRSLHDKMAARTMPRFVFMTPEWVSSARYIVTTRAESEEFNPGIQGVEFLFAEEFTHTPKYAFPDGSHGGFWVHLNYGQITVGAGPVPEELQPADVLTKGQYTPVVPVGRTVESGGMTKEDTEEKKAFSAAAFKAPEGAEPIVKASQQITGKEFPRGLGLVMSVLHDELSKRTSGELPSDYDDTVRSDWAQPQRFDRDPDYDSSWLLYDKFDIYGNPR